MSDDQMRDTLATLHIPNARSNAVNQIVSAAKQSPRRGMLNPFRVFRAWVYVPTIRYYIMAASVAAVIAIGWIGQSPETSSSMVANDKNIEEEHYMVDGIHILDDIDFDEGQWIQDLSAEMG